ncbi:fungal-specific transcription factor domain-containing protein, partial [Halteromyces radiatus]|uniref:fungal-specific transcription factor domain-containing protein n=1 Tax=Halteromyces radiatus TaxID=101107 RepID=UPI00221E4166
MTKATKSTIDKPKRVKVTLACVICRKKKVKCDGIQPCCSRCKAMKLSCEFSEAPRKRGPPKNHVEVIENRAHRIVSLLGKDTSRRPPTNTSPSLSPSPPTTTTTSFVSFHLTTTNALLNLVIGAVDALKEKWKADCILTGGPMTSLAHDTLPQRFKLQLAEKYFANFNLFLPLLSRHHFLHRLVHQPDEMDPLLCYAVCAMGSRYLEHRDDMERLYFEHCLLLFEKLKTDEPTLASVQGVIIMCWYTFLMGDFKKCACLRRHLVDYVRRLNLGFNADPSLSIVQTEQRRRTFWVIYVTDAWLSFYTDARLINMTKEGWNIKKPILEDSQLKAIDSRNLKWSSEEQQPQVLRDETTEAALQMPSFEELIQLASIVGDMFDYLQPSSDGQQRQPAQHLESQLVDWFLHLPSYLEYGKSDVDNAPIAKTIRIMYHTVQIILHQSPLLEKNDSYTRNSICITAADAIINIANEMLQQQDELKLYNTFTMSITLASSVHLESMMTQQDQNINNKERLARSIRVLKDANCSYLTRVDFDRLVDRFLTNRCGLLVDDQFKSSHQLAGMWQILHRPRQSMTQQSVLTNSD